MVMEASVMPTTLFIQLVLSPSRKPQALAAMPSQLMVAVQPPSPGMAHRFMRASIQTG